MPLTMKQTPRAKMSVRAKAAMFEQKAENENHRRSFPRRSLSANSPNQLKQSQATKFSRKPLGSLSKTQTLRRENNLSSPVVPIKQQRGRSRSSPPGSRTSRNRVRSKENTSTQEQTSHAMTAGLPNGLPSGPPVPRVSDVSVMADSSPISEKHCLNISRPRPRSRASDASTARISGFSSNSTVTLPRVSDASTGGCPLREDPVKLSPTINEKAMSPPACDGISRSTTTPLDTEQGAPSVKERRSMWSSVWDQHQPCESTTVPIVIPKRGRPSLPGGKRAVVVYDTIAVPVSAPAEVVEEEETVEFFDSRKVEVDPVSNEVQEQARNKHINPKTPIAPEVETTGENKLNLLYHTPCLSDEPDELELILSSGKTSKSSNPPPVEPTPMTSSKRAKSPSLALSLRPSPLQSLVSPLKSLSLLRSGGTPRRKAPQYKPDSMLAQEKENNSKHQQELERLNNKLSNIQNGLIAIEDERKDLICKTTDLEAEKEALKKELDHREREITILTRRCAEQATRAKENAQFRVTNNDLSRRMLELTDELNRATTKESSVVLNLRKVLQETASERDRLKRELSHIQGQFEQNSRKLTECLESVHSLSDEKRSWEEEKRRFLKQAEYELEQERLARRHADVVVQEELHSKSEEIQNLQRVASQREHIIDTLQSQLSGSQGSIASKAQEFEHEYQQRAQLLESRHVAELNSLRTTLEAEHGALLSAIQKKHKKKLQEGLDMVVALRQELASSHDQLEHRGKSESNLAEELTEMEIEGRHESEIVQLRQSLGELTESSRAKDKRISNLQLQLEDATVASASAAKIHSVLEAKLQSLQEEHETETAKMREQLVLVTRSKHDAEIEHESTVRGLQDQLTALQHSLESKVAQLQGDSTRTSRTHEAEKERLTVKFQGEVTMWKTKLDLAWKDNQRVVQEKMAMEEELQAQISTTKSMLSEEATRMHDKFVAVESTQKETKALCLQQEEDIAILQSRLNERESTLESVKRKLEEKEHCLDVLQEQLSERNASLQTFEDDISSVRNALQLANSASEALKKENIDLVEKCSQHSDECATLREKVSDLSLQFEKDLDEQAMNLKLELENYKVSQSKEVLDIQEHHTSELEKLHEKLDEKVFIIEALETDISRHMDDLMVANSELHKLRDDSKLFNQLAADIEALELDRTALQEQLHDKEMDIAELSAEILKMEIEKELMEQTTNKLGELTSELETERSATARIMGQLEQAKEQVVRLEQDLEDAKALVRRVTHSAEENKEATDKLREASQEEKERLVTSLAQYKQQLFRSDALLKEATATVASQKQETERIESLREKQNTESQETISSLKQTVRCLEKDIRGKDDEIRDLKVVHVYEKDQQISVLKREAEILRADFASKSDQVKDVITEKENECKDLKTRLESLEGLASERTQGLQDQVDQQLKAVADLKRENDLLRTQAEDRMHKATESTAENRRLLAKIQTLESKTMELQEDYRSRRVAEETLKTEKQRLSMQLDKAEQQLEQYCTDRASFERQRRGLLEEVSELETKLGNFEGTTTCLQADILEKSSSINELLQRNKDLETRLENQTFSTERVNSELNVVKMKLADKTTELNDKTAEWKEMERNLEDMIESERSLANVAMNDLRAAQQKLASLEVDNRDKTELEKENKELLDKVQRQQAFLQRKLDKEKVLRNRAVQSSKKAPKPQPYHTPLAEPKMLAFSEQFDDDDDIELDNLLAD